MLPFSLHALWAGSFPYLPKLLAKESTLNYDKNPCIMKRVILDQRLLEAIWVVGLSRGRGCSSGQLVRVASIGAWALETLIKCFLSYTLACF